MKPWIRNLHRWLGLLFSLTILMSSGSGVIHTMMTRTQSAPPAARPTSAGLDVSAIKVTAQEAIERSHADEPTAINLRTISGQPHYQIFSSHGNPVYVNGTNGNVQPTFDETYAAEIASSFLGGAAVRKTDYLTSYDAEYIPIFRILPVYRFDAADGKGTRVYVSTLTGSVTRLTDDEKQFEANVFTIVHKFGFIRNKDLRDWSLTLVTGGAFVVSLLGIVLFFATRRRRKRGF